MRCPIQYSYPYTHGITPPALGTRACAPATCPLYRTCMPRFTVLALVVYAHASLMAVRGPACMTMGWMIVFVPSLCASVLVLVYTILLVPIALAAYTARGGSTRLAATTLTMVMPLTPTSPTPSGRTNGRAGGSRAAGRLSWTGHPSSVVSSRPRAAAASRLTMAMADDDAYATGATAMPCGSVDGMAPLTTTATTTATGVGGSVPPWGLH